MISYFEKGGFFTGGFHSLFGAYLFFFTAVTQFLFLFFKIFLLN